MLCLRVTPPVSKSSFYEAFLLFMGMGKRLVLRRYRVSMQELLVSLMCMLMVRYNYKTSHSYAYMLHTYIISMFTKQLAKP
jgi:hypothetical protein